MLNRGTTAKSKTVTETKTMAAADPVSTGTATVDHRQHGSKVCGVDIKLQDVASLVDVQHAGQLQHPGSIAGAFNPEVGVLQVPQVVQGPRFDRRPERMIVTRLHSCLTSLRRWLESRIVAPSEATPPDMAPEDGIHQWIQAGTWLVQQIEARGARKRRDQRGLLSIALPGERVEPS